jgi:phage-related protein
MRRIVWVKSARKEFEKFPELAQTRIRDALDLANFGAKPDIAKPLTGLGNGVIEIALQFRGDAFRVVYFLQIRDKLWVVHAFQKKSVSGIATPQKEIELIKSRIKQIRELPDD